MRDFGDDVFAGTAKYYSKFRAQYPVQIFDDIISIFNLDGHGRLLDLGCGTGELAIPLAQYFKNVVAVDPDAAMLNEASKKSAKQRIMNIDWQRASSRNLSRITGSFKLVTMGQSFHWMDGETVLKHLYDLVEAKGGVVIIGSVQTKQNGLSTSKDKIIKELIWKYLGPKRRAGKHIYKPTGESWEKELFPNSKFAEFKKYNYEIEISRSIDQVIGNLFSMSWASKNLLGSNTEKFENDLRQKLAQLAGHKKFVDNVEFSMYVLRK
jgi:ubiquinone/menaquinone biosynthesis C-methylase UbiE